MSSEFTFWTICCLTRLTSSRFIPFVNNPKACFIRTTNHVMLSVNGVTIFQTAVLCKLLFCQQNLHHWIFARVLARVFNALDLPNLTFTHESQNVVSRTVWAIFVVAPTHIQKFWWLYGHCTDNTYAIFIVLRRSFIAYSTNFFFNRHLKAVQPKTFFVFCVHVQNLFNSGCVTLREID